MIRALLFDFDGLILDTETAAFVSWQEMYAEHGTSLDLATWASEIGTAGAFDPLQRLEESIGRPVDRSAVSARRQVRKLELIESEVLRPGILDYVHQATAKSLMIAIVSSDSKSWVTGHLRRFGLLEVWHSIHCAENQPDLVKPAPVMYLRALAALGIGATEAIAFEDSPNGIAAAKAAGVFCVAVPTGPTRNLDCSKADLVVEALDRLPLDRLLSLRHPSADQGSSAGS